MIRPGKTHSQAFTLVELLVVIAIIGILVALLLAGDSIKTVLRGVEDGLATSSTDDNDEVFGGEHPGVTLFVFLDGHAESMSNSRGASTVGVNPQGVEDINIDDEWLWLGALSTVAGGEIFQE